MSVLLRIRAIGAVANDELRGELLSPLLVVQKKILEPGAEWAFGVNGTAAGAALCMAACGKSARRWLFMFRLSCKPISTAWTLHIAKALRPTNRRCATHQCSAQVSFQSMPL